MKSGRRYRDKSFSMRHPSVGRYEDLFFIVIDKVDKMCLASFFLPYTSWDVAPCKENSIGGNGRSRTQCTESPVISSS